MGMSSPARPAGHAVKLLGLLAIGCVKPLICILLARRNDSWWQAQKSTGKVERHGRAGPIAYSRINRTGPSSPEGTSGVSFV